MKELHTTKPLLLGIIGLPGAGKSTFAGEFSMMFGAPVVEHDLLKRTVFGDRTVSKADDEGISKLFWLLAEDMAKTKRTFVLDGPMQTYAARSDVRAFAKKAGYDVLWLWIQTSETVARDRVTKPKRGSTHKPMTAQEFEAATKKFQPPKESEDFIVTSGQRTFSAQVRPILARLADAHASNLQPPRPAERTTQATPRDRGSDGRPPRRNIFIR